jgi:hypothetical protein
MCSPNPDLHAPCLTPGCTLQAGLNQPAARAVRQGQLTCKDSLLVGWGGAADHDTGSCPIVGAVESGTSVEMQGCTLQYHPDSKHTLDTSLLMVANSAQVALSQCRLVGPAPGNTTAITSGLGVSAGSTATLVRWCWTVLLLVVPLQHF